MASNYFAHSLLRAHDWQHRPQLDDVCRWWRGGGRGVLALVGMGGAGKTAIAERFLRLLPGGLPDDPDVPKDGSLPTPQGVFAFSFYDAPNPEAFFEALQMWLEHSPRVQTVLSLGQMLFLLQQTPGLLVLDGLEKVQEDGVRGLLGRLESPKLREFLDRIAAGYFPELSVLITSRFPLADLRDARPQFFGTLPIEEIELPAGIRLLRARGVHGADPELEGIVNACGRHALTVDFAGGYIAEFGGGDPATPVDFDMDSARLRQRLDDEPDEARRLVLKQGHRFARLAERYRDAMLGGTTDRREGDAAALALLQRICLFRLGVDAETLANIFTGENAVKVSGPALAGLNREQLQKKLDWLVRMRIVEASTRPPASSSPLRPETRHLKPLYSIHPAVRDGFLSGIGEDALRENHEAVRQGLQVSLGDAPGENPSDPATLDLLEEIVHHTLQSDHVPEAWDIYWNRIGNYKNLGWRLGAYERGERICRAFAGGVSPESLVAPHPPDGRSADRRVRTFQFTGSRGLSGPRSKREVDGKGRSPANAPALRTLPYQSLAEATQAIFINEWALYLKNLGRLAAAARCHELHLEMRMQRKNWANASIGNRNLSEAWLLSGRLTAGQAAAAEALRLAELADDAPGRCSSHAFRAHSKALRGEAPSALADFRTALDWQHKAEGKNRTLWGLRGFQHTGLLVRIGRRDETRQFTEQNKQIQWQVLGEMAFQVPQCNLILSNLHCEAGDLAQAETLVASAHDWAVARDAKEALCWSALVQARIELAKALAVNSPERAQHTSPGHRPGLTDPANPQALKGRNKPPAEILSRPFRAHPDVMGSGTQGYALGWCVADPSGLESAETALADGLKIARDCGFGLYHSDLLLERARLHLMCGEPQAALDDLRTSLDVGVPANEQTGQPQLLPATHAECGYAWAIAEGLQLRAEALLLQAAQTLGTDSFAPAKRNSLPTAVRDLLTQAESCLTESLARWQPLHDPEPERPDQNFQLDGKPYNHRAAETHRLLTELAAGTITRYPIESINTPNPHVPNTKEAAMRNRIYLSFSYSEDDFRVELAEVIKGDIRLRDLFWDDKELKPGENWEVAMNQAVAEARVMIMLVSPRYLDQQQCQAWKYEIPPALEAYRKGELTIMWIPARPVRVRDTPFPEILAAHPLSEPLDTLSPADRKLAYERIKQLILQELGLDKMKSFHVFLSHNSKDKPAVKQLGLELKQRGLNPWLDEWELRPGLGWQDALEDIIRTCQSAAICVADNGIGPWEDPEMKALLRRFVNEKKSGNILPVIPVLLPGAPALVELPLFLGEFTWVDLRGGFTKDGLDKLVWGITGKKPNP